MPEPAPFPPSETIDAILQAHRASLGADFERYRNHVYRVYHLALFSSGEQENPIWEVAAAFHDLGIWTAGTWDYLQPSIDLAEEWLETHGQGELGESVARVIDQHHKIRRYSGTGAQLVEPFRRADWLDVCLGWRYRKEFKTVYSALRAQYPYLGFHRRLIRFFLRHWLRNPFRPLPMMK